MSGLRMNLRKKPVASGREEFGNSSPVDRRYGFWGTVTEVHPEDCTVHVRTDTGHIITGVRVASMEWATVYDEDPKLSGERHLPPVDTFVFCMMPNGEMSSAFVLCSGFAKAESVHAYFKQKDKGDLWERIENSKWTYTTDYKTGTKTFKNRPEDETVCLEIDQEDGEGEEKAVLTVHGTKLTIDKDGITLETDGKVSLTIDKDAELEVKGKATVKVEKDADIQVKGNASLKADGDAKVEGKNVEVTASAKAQVKGAKVVIGGTVTPKGSGAFCGMPFCAFTGAPQSGDTSMGA